MILNFTEAQGKLAEVLTAMDKLNSWVRSEHYRKSGQSCKRAVYFFKRLALKSAGEQGWVVHRGVHFDTKCHKCNGTGRYEDGNGFTHNHCWDCDSKGIARLKFLESNIIPLNLRWHSPEGSRRNSTPTSVCYYLGSVAAVDWEPNAKGKDLTLVEAVDCLNLVETFFVDRPENQWHEDIGGPFNDFCYSLNLGDSSPIVRCEFCAKIPDLNDPTLHIVRHSTARAFIEFNGFACNTCSEKSGLAIYEQFALPKHLLTPAMEEWSCRHVDFYNAKLAKKDSDFGNGKPKKEYLRL